MVHREDLAWDLTTGSTFYEMAVSLVTPPV